MNTNNTRRHMAGHIRLFTILIAAAAVLCIRAYAIDRIIVSGVSMNDTFASGDVLWAQKFDTEKLQRYDVVVAKIDGKKVIKRVIGLPGETVAIIDGQVCINGICLDDDVYGGGATAAGVLDAGVTLADGEYIILGDNRAASRDSRVYGAVSSDLIIAKVRARIYPLDKIFFSSP